MLYFSESASLKKSRFGYFVKKGISINTDKRA